MSEFDGDEMVYMDGSSPCDLEPKRSGSIVKYSDMNSLQSNSKLKRKQQDKLRAQQSGCASNCTDKGCHIFWI